jgi:hypothetical protein
MSKWVEETSRIILAARENRFIAPQTVLVSPGGRRFRLLCGARSGRRKVLLRIPCYR